MSLRNSQTHKTVDVTDSAYNPDEARIEINDPFVSREYREYEKGKRQEKNEERARQTGEAARAATEQYVTYVVDSAKDSDIGKEMWAGAKFGGSLITSALVCVLTHKILSPVFFVTRAPARITGFILKGLVDRGRPQEGNVAFMSNMNSSKLVRGDIVNGYAIGGEYLEDRGTHLHQGVDLKSAVGTPIIAPYPVVVEKRFDKTGYGLYGMVKPAGNNPQLPGVLVAHMSQLFPGTHQAGAIIGYTGGALGDPNGGRTTGPHLHFEEFKNVVRVHPTRGTLEAFLTGRLPIGGTGMMASGDTHITALVTAFIGKESGGDCNAENPHEPAIGSTQVMIPNITGTNGWDVQYLGRDITPDEFQGNCELQRELTTLVVGDYWNQTPDYQDHSTRVRMVGAMWYGGPDDMNSYEDDRPQCSIPGDSRSCYDSFQEYTTSFLSMYEDALGTNGTMAALPGGLTRDAIEALFPPVTW